MTPTPIIGLSITAQRRFAGNAVVAPQAHLMLQRTQFAFRYMKGTL